MEIFSALLALYEGNSPVNGEFPSQRPVTRSSDLLYDQSGRSPKVVALFSATNFSSYIIELHQRQDAIQIQWNYAWIHYNIAKRSHLMI